MRYWWIRIQLELKTRELLKLNKEWREHTDKCSGCQLAATGNRSQRRKYKPRFCPVAAALIFRLEELGEQLKKLWKEKEMHHSDAKPGREAG